MARFYRRRKFCRFTAENVTYIDYQRQLALAIKQARYLSLIPYTDNHK